MVKAVCVLSGEAVKGVVKFQQDVNKMIKNHKSINIYLNIYRNQKDLLKLLVK
jgi:hypothetical protein